MRRRLSRTHAVLGRVILKGWVPMSGRKVGSFVGLSANSALHWWSAQCAAHMLLSNKLMSCCAVGTNGCLGLRLRVFALGGQVSAEWSRCPGSMARRSRDSMAPLRWSSAGWIPVRMGRLSASVGRRHHNWQGVGDGWSISGCEQNDSRQKRSVLLWNAPVQGWLFAALLLQHPNRS